MSKIKYVKARQILDSRGNPTVEVDVVLDSGEVGRAAVPSGASKGKYEALELRDNDKSYFLGKGVIKAVRNIQEVIGPKIIGQQPDFHKIDKSLIDLDATDNKSNLGANAILAVSLATAKAAAAFRNESLFYSLGGRSAKILPIPLMNILNGGIHADNNLDIQEFMIAPIGAPTFAEAIRMGAEVFHSLKSILGSKGFSVSVGDEGGFAPCLDSNIQALEMILKAVEKAGYRPGKDIFLALDVAASSFSLDSGYKFEARQVESKQLIDYYEDLSFKFPLFSIEDGLAEDDWSGWQELTAKLGRSIQLVGDDLFVTNINRLQRGIEDKIANAILIKLNQIGTLSETLTTIELAKKNGYSSIVSHRSGETEDTTIAHLAVGVGCGQIKTGSVSRSERVAKYNELIRIEEELGKDAVYAGTLWKR